MMLHNQDEIGEFDQQLSRILKSLDTLPNSEIYDSVRALMANLFWHDFTEWSQQRGRWSFPDSILEAFDPDDEQNVRSVVASCVTILKSSGRRGIAALHEAGAAYLRNRGVDSSPVVVNVHEIAAMIGIEAKNIPTAKKAAWGPPISKGVKSRPATYDRDRILPILEEQWPDKPWHKL